ncbi:aldehyde dehydrogenase family protein, partial [Streptomyces nondiastaticus]
MSSAETIHIDGVWRAAASGAQREVLDPADAKTLAVVSEGGADDTDAAVAAARRAFEAVSGAARIVHAAAGEVPY